MLLSAPHSTPTPRAGSESKGATPRIPGLAAADKVTVVMQAPSLQTLLLTGESHPGPLRVWLQTPGLAHILLAFGHGTRFSGSVLTSEEKERLQTPLVTTRQKTP